MCLFVNCLIENPSFDSQTKETMTLRASHFGSTYQVSPKFVKEGNNDVSEESNQLWLTPVPLVEQSGIIDNIVKFVKFKEQQLMTKADKGKMAR